MDVYWILRGLCEKVGMSEMEGIWRLCELRETWGREEEKKCLEQQVN